jgi:hypothetical protein
MDTRMIINLFHVIFVAPFLIWVGIIGAKLPDRVFSSLIALGVLLILYQGYKAWGHRGSQYIWINLIHILWIGPLLIYIGVGRSNTKRPAYDLLLLTAFGALGYHLYVLATQYGFF